MLTDNDYLEALRRYKNIRKVNGHERQRYHALLLVHRGYSYRETAAILMVDEETVRGWVKQYEDGGLDRLKNHPYWGGEHGQRELSDTELAELQKILTTEAMPGTGVGSGWTAKAVRDVIEARFGATYRPRGLRKLLYHIGWSYQRGRKLFIQRRPEEQARYEAETAALLAELAESGRPVLPLAGDESKVYLEGTIARRWNPVGQQPLIPDGSRSKKSENIYGAVHLGTGAEVTPFVIDWQNSDATIRWFEMLLAEHPRVRIVLWLDGAGHHTGEEVEEWLAQHPRLQVIHFPAYTPEENPQEQAWKPLKDATSHHRWHATVTDLSKAIDEYYQKGKRHVVTFLEKFGYFWKNGRIYPLPGTT